MARAHYRQANGRRFAVSFDFYLPRIMATYAVSARWERIAGGIQAMEGSSC